MRGYSIPSFVFCFLKAFLEKAVPFLALLSITTCKQTQTVGKRAYAPVSVVSRVACRFFHHKYLQQFLLGNLRVPCSFKMVKTEVPVASCSTCLSVYLFVVDSWAFAPECSVRSPGLE